MKRRNLAEVWIPDQVVEAPKSLANLTLRVIGSFFLGIIVTTLGVFGYRYLLYWYVPVGFIASLLLILTMGTVVRYFADRVGSVLFTLATVLTCVFFTVGRPEAHILIALQTDSTSWIYTNAAFLLITCAPILALLPIALPNPKS